MLNKITGLESAVQLLANNAIPGGVAGPRGTRDAEDSGIIRQARQTARLHRRSAYLIIGKLPKQLAKAFNMFIK